MAFNENDLNNAGFTSSPFDFWGSPVLTAPDGSLFCPGYDGKTYQPSSWDHLVIGIPYNPPDQPWTPGACEISVRKNRDVDKKKAAGGDGARITIHGLEPALVEIRLTIWTPDQLRVLNDIWPVLFPGLQKKTLTKQVTTYVPTGKTRTEVISIIAGKVKTNTIPLTRAVTKTVPAGTKTTNQTIPYDVDHPTLKLHQIRSLVFVGGEGPMPGSVTRSKVFVMHAVEWIQVNKTSATSTPTQPAGSIYDAPQVSTPGSDPRNTGPN